MDNGIVGRPDETEEIHSTNLVRLFGQIIMLPLTVFVQSMDLFVKTIQGMQRAADKGVNELTKEVTTANQVLGGQGHSASTTTSQVTDGATEGAAARIDEEERDMPDRNLSDDMLKLVRYKILFVKRDFEVAFDEREELIPDNISDTAYTAWKVAEFIQRLSETKVPRQWWDGGSYEKDRPKYPKHAVKKPDGWVVQALDEDDKKYLRVYFEVLDRYVREDLEYEQQGLDKLTDIQSELKDIAKAVRDHK